MDRILAKCLQGQEWAWDAFVHRYAPVILAAVRRILIARGLTADQQTAEDITQDVFLRLVRDDFHLLRTHDHNRSALTTWLNIIARSSAIDFLRRKQLPTTPLDLAANIASPLQAPDPASATENLPPGLLTARQRLVLHLIFDREMEILQIASLLAISPQTVRSTRHKAIIKLRKHLKKHDSS